MEEYLIFAAIGGLLLLTLLVNSVAEAYEQNQREKRIKILRIKQGLDELSGLLDGLKNCDVSDNIRNLIANEIMSRLQMIQKLDRHFRGIQTLIEEAKAGHESVAQANMTYNINDEAEFKKKLIKLGRLIRILNSNHWYSNVKAEQLKQYSEDIKLLRCEKVFQFYSDMAGEKSEKENYLAAKEHYYYILQALKGSGINSHPRITELLEQTEFMLDQTDKLFIGNAKKIMDERAASEEEEENASATEEKEDNNDEIENPQADSTPENAQSVPPENS